jgi:hypothetical protein
LLRRNPFIGGSLGGLFFFAHTALRFLGINLRFMGSKITRSKNNALETKVSIADTQ